MKAVLGIDAAWTATQHSGVALVIADADDWQLHSVWPSYAAFLGHNPEHLAADLIRRSQDACGVSPSLIAIDMPLSLEPITARRVADREVSRAYGAKWASTHSPSATRPGAISDRLTEEWTKLGYTLRTASSPDGCLAEVYPHPALIEFLGAATRLPYKVQKAGKYWPEKTNRERRQCLVEQWSLIIEVLEAGLPGVRNALPLPHPEASTAALKSFEDQLDAVVCAAVGVEVLRGHARAYGDSTNAIWIPSRPLPPAATSA